MAYPLLSQSLPSVGRGAALDLSNEVDELLDDDELANQEIGYTSRDNILFCIDGSLAMQTPLPDATSLAAKTDEDDTDAEGRSLNTAGKGKSPLHIALESVLGVMRGKILSGPSDFIGVLVYNIDRYSEELSRAETSGSALDTTQHGTILYLPLRQIGADEIKGLNQFMEDANAGLAAQDTSEKGREQPDIISQTFPPAQPGDEVDIADALEGCLHAFRDAGAKLPGNKRIFLVTNNDRPDRPQGQATSSGSNRMDTRGPARTRYMDLLSLGVIVDPFFISSPHEPFDNEYYWNDILNRVPEEQNSDDNDPSVLPTVTIDSGDGLAKLQEIMLEQVFRTSSKRVLFSVPLKFGGKDGDIMISVNGYSVITSMKKPTTKLYDLSGRQPVEAKSRTLYTSTATGDRLDTNEIGFAYNFGKSDSATTLTSAPWQQRMKDYYEEHGAPDDGDRADNTEPEEEDEEEEEEEEEEETGGANKQAGGKTSAELTVQTRVALTAKDIREYKSLGLDPQIKIIGFMNPKNVRFELNVKNSIFLYPDEKTFTGSTRTFAALLASCLSRNKCALAFAFTRRTSTPYYAALIPQAEAQLEGGGQASPPGFHMIPLPFADDLRARPEKVPKAMQLCTSEQVEAMSAVLKKLRLKQTTYEPRAYPNPGLNYFFGQLQALAFEEEFKPEKMYDKTKPLLDGMHQHGGNAMREFNESLAADGRAAPPSVRTAATKRGNPGGADLPVATDVYMEESWRSGLLSKMTVAQLKGYAQHVGLQPEGKTLKGDWMRVISEHFEAASDDVKPNKKSRTR